LVTELMRTLRKRVAVQPEAFTQELEKVLCAPDAPRLTLEPAERRALEQALAGAFPLGTDLAHTVRVHLHENLDAIAHGANLREVIYHLSEWGAARGRMPDLIAAAVQEAPGNLDLQLFLCRLAAAAPGPAPDDNQARARLLTFLRTPPALRPALAIRPAERTLLATNLPESVLPNTVLLTFPQAQLRSQDLERIRPAIAAAAGVPVENVILIAVESGAHLLLWLPAPARDRFLRLRLPPWQTAPIPSP